MKTTLLTLIALAITVFSFGQAPEAFKYQAVVRDAGGVILTNQAVGYQLSILQGSPSGTAVYTETFTPTTNNYGLVNIEIGTGNTVDNFSLIDWGNGPYYIETAVDVTGGTSYAVMGTSQMVSVPFALYSKSADSVVNDMVDDADADPNNEIQAMSFSNDTLYLSDGGQVYLGAYGIDLVDDADNNPTNEIQDISLTGTDLSISGGSTVDLSTVQDGVNDADADPNNEIQAISFSNDTLYLSNGGQVYLGAYGIDLVDDADNNPTNEIQDISLTGTDLSISGGSTIDLSAIQDGVNDADADPTNELQTWSTLPGIPIELTKQSEWKFYFTGAPFTQSNASYYAHSENSNGTGYNGWRNIGLNPFNNQLLMHRMLVVEDTIAIDSVQFWVLKATGGGGNNIEMDVWKFTPYEGTLPSFPSTKLASHTYSIGGSSTKHISFSGNGVQAYPGDFIFITIRETTSGVTVSSIMHGKVTFQ